MEYLHTGSSLVIMMPRLTSDECAGQRIDLLFLSSEFAILKIV